MFFLWHFQMKMGDRCSIYGIFSHLMFYHHMKDMKYSCPNILWNVHRDLCKVETGWAKWLQGSKKSPDNENSTAKFVLSSRHQDFLA